METTSEEIIARIEHSYNQLVRLYRSVPVVELLEPVFANGWSIKDLLAHIATWEWRCVGLLGQAHDTNTPLQAMPDVDALNEEIYRERKEWRWEDVENDFREAHRALLQSIKALPPDRLQDPKVQKAISEETWEHYEEHLPGLIGWHEQIVSRSREFEKR